MTKVFRLHNNGSGTISDWQNSEKYGNKVIDDIQDPDGANAKKEITSIPSPFARIDLAKTAFKEVVNSKKLDGKTIYHKMVSDCLDIGEIFFNYTKYTDKFDIIHWDKEKDLNKLTKDGYKEHKIFAETLQTYLESDQLAYNFDKMEGINLLRYKGAGRPNDMAIVGATSPATLFFSSANKLDYVKDHVDFDGIDRPFDGTFRPLCNRDIEYVKYLFAIRAAYPAFAKDFKEVNDYLDLTLKALNDDKKNIISALNANSIQGYNQLKLPNSEMSVKVIRDISLCVRPEIVIQSDFEIQSTICQDNPLPLALPNAKGDYDKLRYTRASWNNDNAAPYYNRLPIAERILPFEGAHHPYLTLSDLLEDTIVKMPYPMDTDHYFAGQYSSNENSYLLPLTETFFRYFSVDDLLKSSTSGNPMIELKELEGGCHVTLRVPIKGNASKHYMEYQRKYYKGVEPQADRNEGGEIEKKIGLGIMPLCHVLTQNIHSRIALFDKGPKDVTLHCYRGTGEVKSIHRTRLDKNVDDGTCGVETYVVKEAYDRIVVDVDNHHGVIIPKMKARTGNAKFTFAVDFGTTNTHIEYSINGNPPMSFDITAKEKQMIPLHVAGTNDNGKKEDLYGEDVDICSNFEDHYVPSAIGESGEVTYNFPIRSVLAESKQLDYNKGSYEMADGNIAFVYAKKKMPDCCNTCTNLKWGQGKEGQARMNLYIANICMLLRNKVVLNDGDLKQTKIIWFYPASMNKHRIQDISKIWEENYKTYFNGNINNLTGQCESVAPYNYFVNSRGKCSDIVTVDIGGGTTDVFVVSDGNPVMLSSLRFASNAIFGDDYGNSPANNGFVQRYHEHFLTYTEDEDENERHLALDDIARAGKSSDICSTYFSLNETKLPALDFTKQLSEDSVMKYPFALFYSAIIYFIAREMKAKNLPMPQKICFSGNGSLTLQVLTTSTKDLGDYFKRIFEKVYGKEYDNDKSFNVIVEEDPKRATCKGGIAAKDNVLDFSAVKKLQTSLLGIDDKTFTDDDTYQYNLLKDTDMDKVVRQVKDFIDFVFDLGRKEKYFKDYFGMDMTAVEAIKEECTRDLQTYLQAGIDNMKQELKSQGDEDGRIEETLFFYPIVGMLNHVAAYIQFDLNNI